MNIEEAIKAMKGGAKLTHKYLPAMGKTLKAIS